MCTSRCGSLNGNGRRKRSSIRLKIEVFKPIPSASVRTAMTVNPGDLRSCRNAKRNSFISFCSQRHDWINARCAACRYPRSQERRDEEKQPHAEINPRIDAFDFEKHTLQCARKSDRGDQSDCRSIQEQLHSMRKHEHADLVGPGAKRETNADFTNAFDRRVSEKPVETDGRERERESSEDREKKTEQALASPTFAHAIGHRTRIEHG